MSHLASVTAPATLTLGAIFGLCGDFGLPLQVADRITSAARQRPHMIDDKTGPAMRITCLLLELARDGTRAWDAMAVLVRFPAICMTAQMRNVRTGYAVIPMADTWRVVLTAPGVSIAAMRGSAGSGPAVTTA